MKANRTKGLPDNPTSVGGISRPLKLHEIYRGKTTVWVEDEITYEFLTRLWGTPAPGRGSINICIGHSKEGVGYLVQSVPRNDWNRVSGFVDCDFDAPNGPNWAEPGTRIFLPDQHEIENFLLDFDAWAAESGEVDAATIQQRAEDIARNLHWWMAAKKTLRQMKKTLSTDFPPDPKVFSAEVQDLKSVISHITSGSFPASQIATLKRWTQQQIEASVQRNYDDFEADLLSGRWRRTFSGKEIYRVLKSRVARVPQKDLDLAKRLADRIALNPPKEIMQLRDILLSRR